MVSCELFVMVILEGNDRDGTRPHFMSYNELQIADLALIIVVKRSL